MTNKDILNEATNYIRKKMEEDIFKTFGVSSEMLSTSTTITASTAKLSKELFDKSIDILLANKVEYKPSMHATKGNPIIFDHEEMRKSLPNIKERGKTIFYHPDDEKIIQKFKNPA